MRLRRRSGGICPSSVGSMSQLIFRLTPAARSEPYSSHENKFAHAIPCATPAHHWLRGCDHHRRACIFRRRNCGNSNRPDHRTSDRRPGGSDCGFGEFNCCRTLGVITRQNDENIIRSYLRAHFDGSARPRRRHGFRYRRVADGHGAVAVGPFRHDLHLQHQRHFSRSNDLNTGYAASDWGHGHLHRSREPDYQDGARSYQFVGNGFQHWA